MRDIWEVTPNLRMHIGTVHRLSSWGAVSSYMATGASPDGVHAEWSMILVLTVEADRISRVEIFDEADLDAALARFDELERSTPPLENAATRTWQRQADAFNRQDLEGFLGLIGSNGRNEDRRKGFHDVVEGEARRNAARAMFQTAPRGR